MNYDKYKNFAFEVEKMGLDVNGNSVRKLIFYKKDSYGELVRYKTTKTNEQINHLSNDEIIQIWG